LADLLPDPDRFPPSATLGPLDNEAAEALVKAALGPKVQIDPWAMRRVLEVTSHHPLYIRRVIGALQECCPDKSILMQPDVEEAVEYLLEQGLPEFEDIWQSLSAQQQFVLASLGTLRGTRGAATQYDVRTYCEQHGYLLSWSEISTALDNLAERGILEKLGANNYRFSVQLLRLWVRRYRPPRYALREGRWRSGYSPAAFRVAKLKRALARRPGVWMSAVTVLLVIGIVVLQPVFWQSQERAHATESPTPRPGAASTSTRATRVAVAVPATNTTQTPVSSPTPALPGHPLACMSRLVADGPWQLLLLDPLSGDQLRLTETTSNERTPRWSPDGRRLAFVSDRDGNREVYVMDVALALGSDTTSERALINVSQHKAPDWQPAWSPDGSRLAFASYRDDNWELYLVDADGSNLMRLTVHAENDFSPSWSPDGRRLVFASRRFQDADLFVVDTATGELTQLTTGTRNEFDPAWSPNGEWIAYVTQLGDQGDVFVMRADGSEATNLTNSPYANDFQPTWSPDSEWLTFVSYTTAEGDHDLWQMRRDGSELSVLFDDDYDNLAPNWRPSAP
jgi:Tol biopolymer transport system component